MVRKREICWNMLHLWWQRARKLVVDYIYLSWKQWQTAEVHLPDGIQRNEGIIQVYSGVDTVDSLQNGDSLEPHEMSSKAPPRLPATSYSWKTSTSTSAHWRQVHFLNTKCCWKVWFPHSLSNLLHWQHWWKCIFKHQFIKPRQVLIQKEIATIQYFLFGSICVKFAYDVRFSLIMIGFRETATYVLNAICKYLGRNILKLFGQPFQTSGNTNVWTKFSFLRTWTFCNALRFEMKSEAKYWTCGTNYLLFSSAGLPHPSIAF